jgi:phosphoenolpyruvate carboxylase
VFKNGVVQEISGPKRDDITTDLRKMYSKELHDFKSSLNIIQVIIPRRMRWKGHVACMGQTRTAYRVLVRTPAGKITLQ